MITVAMLKAAFETQGNQSEEPDFRQNWVELDPVHGDLVTIDGQFCLQKICDHLNAQEPS